MGYTAYDPSLYLKGGAAAYAVGSAAYNYYNQRYDSGAAAVTMGGGATSVRRSRRRIGKTKRRSTAQVFQAVLGAGVPSISRWQLASANYIGAGRVPIEYRQTNDFGDLAYVPIHFMPLTGLYGTYANTTVHADDVDHGIYNIGMSRLIFNSTSGGFNYQPLQSNTRVGYNSPDVLGKWQIEQNSFGLDNTDNHGNRQFHKYTDVKMNLYGAMNIPVVYTVMLVQFTGDDYNPSRTPPLRDIASISLTNTIPGNSDCANMFKDILRPLVGQNMNTNGYLDWRKSGNVRIIKSERIKIDPLPYTEAAAEAATTACNTGNIHELRWFIRHDRFRNYQWAETAANTVTDLTLNDGGWDVHKRSIPLGDVDWTKRMYLMVTASVPEIGNTTNGYTNVPVSNNGGYINSPTTAEADKWFGSYDICVRNAFIMRDS
jgi:hypothetical protein